MYIVQADSRIQSQYRDNDNVGELCFNVLNEENEQIKTRMDDRERQQC
jgi:hypothetical protein